jgi:hypothetical protein
MRSRLSGKVVGPLTIELAHKTPDFVDPANSILAVTPTITPAVAPADAPTAVGSRIRRLIDHYWLKDRFKRLDLLAL